MSAAPSSRRISTYDPMRGTLTEPPPLPYASFRPLNAQEYSAVVEEVKLAIREGIQPTRIAQGSSGSYFCRNRQGQIVGVFKPKNEEPYGKLNPKWTKWLHKTCCPCCFGRSCLTPNLGYVSEASASVLDRHLGLGVVPRTEIIALSSPSFAYSYLDKRSSPIRLPEKIGSFQLFMHDYTTASTFLRQGPQMLTEGRLPRDRATGGLDNSLQRSFQDQFERMIILDYIMRNTDRGLDNWMIKVFETEDEEDSAGTTSTDKRDDDIVMVGHPRISVAAIDNGLSFPFKHPDEWRIYNFGWSFLPAARVPFSEATLQRNLPMLTDPHWWDRLIADLRRVAKMDADFDEKLFKRQVAVMKGQSYNIIQILKRSAGPSPASGSNATDSAGSSVQLVGTPLDLVRMPPCLVWEDEDVRSLVRGDYGDIVGRDGTLGTIIGSNESTVPTRPALPTRPARIEVQRSPAPFFPDPETVYDEENLSTSRIPRHVDTEPYPESMGEFLTSSSGVRLPPRNTASAQSSGDHRDEDIRRLVGSGSGAAGGATSANAHQRRQRRQGNLQYRMDAFRGRVITFVKSQPWFSSW